MHEMSKTVHLSCLHMYICLLYNPLSNSMIIKMDDDVVYDVYKILKILKQLPHKLFLGGQLFAKTKPYRGGDSKWSVSRKYWPKVHYPPYVSGKLEQSLLINTNSLNYKVNFERG